MKKAALSLLVAVLSLFEAWAVEWKAQWIGAPWDGEEFDSGTVMPAPQFRKVFEAPERIKSATAYVTGLGFFEFYVNGSKAGDEVLSPNETSYSHRNGLDRFEIAMDDTRWRDFRVMYLTYDITDMLVRGSNELGAVVGNGFFSTGRTRWVSPYGTPRFICQVEIEYAGGGRETIVSDSSWEVCRSPILLNDLFEGEVYDTRLESDAVWEPAAVRKAPDGRLLPQDGPADRVVEVLKPKNIRQLDDGRWEVSFGDYVSGWVRLKNINAPAGTEIELEFPIETAGNGAGDGSNIFALAMGVPAECRDKVVAAVKAELEANGGHLNTGIFGTGLFSETLCDYGMAEEAYAAMTKTDFPGFGWWVEQGAQTTWEQWNGEGSHNHPMFGGALVWLYRKICGVQTDEAEARLQAYHHPSDPCRRPDLGRIQHRDSLRKALCPLGQEDVWPIQAEGPGPFRITRYSFPS